MSAAPELSKRPTSEPPNGPGGGSPARFELWLPLYNAIQKLANGDYPVQKAAVADALRAQREQAGRPPRVLEFACGAGNLAGLFPAESYLGVDAAAPRIAAARERNPRHRFECQDVSEETLEPLVRGHDFFFCNALLHHLSDAEVAELLGAVGRLAPKPATLLAIEPILPTRPWREPLAFLIGKLDRGRFVRTEAGYRGLFGDSLKEHRPVPRGRWWPQAGGVFVAKFL